jgi:hypothetical protein
MAYNNGGVQIDFTSGIANVTASTIPISMHNASATISDAEGNLAFYTNGCQIYSHTHTLMENGGGINPGEVHDQYCYEENWGYPNSTQSTIVLPWPGRLDEYIMLHKPMSFEYNTSGQITGVGSYGFYYTHIEMTANDGRGRVVDKNVLIDDTNFEGGAISVTKHGNGIDWWVVTPLRRSNEYAIFLVDSDGVHFHAYQADGIEDTGATEGGGQSRFNVDGNQ